MVILMSGADSVGLAAGGEDIWWNLVSNNDWREVGLIPDRGFRIRIDGLDGHPRDQI